MAELASFKFGERRQLQHRRKGLGFVAAVVGLVGLCSCRWTASDAVAWVSPSRRQGAMYILTAATLGSQAGAALAEDIPGRAIANPGQNDKVDFKRNRDPPEVVAARREARVKEEKRQSALKEEFRGIFSEFAQEATEQPKRVQLLGQMQGIVIKEQMLPLGITRDDVVRGVRAVKFNSGCVKGAVKKGECKDLERAYMKLLNTIDKVYDRSIVSASGR